MKAIVQTEFLTTVRGEELRCAALAAEAALRKVIDEDWLVYGTQCHGSYFVKHIRRCEGDEWVAKVVATRRAA